MISWLSPGLRSHLLSCCVCHLSINNIIQIATVSCFLDKEFYVSGKITCVVTTTTPQVQYHEISFHLVYMQLPLAWFIHSLFIIIKALSKLFSHMNSVLSLFSQNSSCSCDKSLYPGKRENHNYGSLFSEQGRVIFDMVKFTIVGRLILFHQSHLNWLHVLGAWLIHWISAFICKSNQVNWAKCRTSNKNLGSFWVSTPYTWFLRANDKRNKNVTGVPSLHFLTVLPMICNIGAMILIIDQVPKCCGGHRYSCLPTSS